MSQSTVFSVSHRKSAYFWNDVGWLCYWLIFNIYCFVWREYAAPEVYSLADSNLWFLKEWLIWLALSHALIYFLRRSSPNNVPHKMPLGITLVLGATVCLLLAVSIRAWLNTGEYANDWRTIAVIMLPKYASAYCIVVVCWLFFEGPTRSAAVDKDDTLQDTAVYIDVEKRGLRIDLPSADIFSLKAAGNYVEIATESEIYLKRITLAQLLQKLPGKAFMRVHRSYAINTEKLQSLVNAENGAAVATLTNQHVVPVSKRYKPALKQVQAAV
ncbi:LytTR family DNA-binding domain-containing protein [Gilvimarinus sp. SDUM040013]|uniref:LytTR family DNA-binding domain-containing protein n=1 Tax=Gilvimarinus gilvus TaxID=3058038 RepID=A0ABU4S4C2_9GAMM|nr:LytTR family DNA-binding domain-containing protein [Gilvimarinus sp. SDUM040013]MDO3387497.1 LytTR family DNA-binding domain-containing protein [Gilvimarinus sp. SDUM040013]MDX6851357.1 LytTR family DNA-binding domain-containing protein [Gilvimarinus sp. SDUM040013]